MTILEELEQQLREKHKFSLYEHCVAREQPATDAEKEEIAKRVLYTPTPIPWAMGMAIQAGAVEEPFDIEALPD